jgi:hypothetical protein
MAADVPPAAAGKPHFTPLKYNSEGTTYMKAALCSSAVVGDFDGDGDDDVYLAAGGGTQMSGTWYFENVTPSGTKGAPTSFKARVRRGDCAGGIRCTLADGSSAVVARQKVNYDFEKNPAAFKPFGGDLPANVHYGKVRANYWRLRDFDGDGRDDIIVGIGDWREYGWHCQYSSGGVWTNAQIHGYVYVLLNEGGARGHEKWSEPRLLRIENGDPVESFGNASPMLEDWDGDGDLDLILGTPQTSCLPRPDRGIPNGPALKQLMLQVFYLENVAGPREEPRFADPVGFKVNGEDLNLGVHANAPVPCMLGPVSSGANLLVGCESGRLFWIARKDLQPFTIKERYDKK